MKTQIALILLTTITTALNAQTWSGTTPGNIYYNSGNVGIGLTNPSEKLVIDGNLKLNQPSSKIYWDWTSRGIEQYSADGGTSQMIRFSNSMGTEQTNPNGGFDFTDYQGNSILRINDFKVGIGTNQPETKLEVTGSGVDPNVLKLSSFDVQTNTISMVFHPRKNFLPNPASSITGILDYGMANQEKGSLSFNTSNSGQLSEKMRIRYDGNVGIGTITPDSKLTVAGNIHSREVKVTVNAGADFVFQDGYDLRTLREVEQFINKNKHLPDIQPAKDMEEKGLELGKMDMKLLQKIEELTLYMIDLKKEMDKMKEENEKLKNRIIELEKD